MLLLRCHWPLAGLMVLATTGTTFGQETPPLPREGASADAKPSDDANPYAALRNSKNRGTKALAERYADLIGTQVWTDAKGKFKTRARYVRHDPQLKWVVLANTTGRGPDRTVKEVTVQVVQLSRQSQSRVRQIAALQKKLDALAAEEQPEPTFTGIASNAAGSEYGATTERDSRRGGRAAEDETAAANPFQWATSYDAFRANFKLLPDANGKKSLDWGELNELREMGEAAPSAPAERNDPAVAPRVLTPDEAEKLGEVHWEAPSVRAQRMKSGEGTARFDLPPLPRPLKLRFLIDKDAVKSWTDLPADQTVRFIGRFESVSPREIVIRVRLANSDIAGAAPVDPSLERRGQR